MKKLVLAFSVGLLLWAVSPASAFVSPVESERGRAILQKMGNDLAGIAARFDCPDFAWANFTDGGRVAAFVYLPKGESVKTAKRQVSIAIHALEGDAAKDKATMVALAKQLQESYKAKSKVLKNEVFHNAKDEPGFFIEYTIGEGAAKEHNAGVFMRLTSHTAAFIQLQSPDKPMPAADSAKVKALLAAPASAAKPAAAKKG